MTLESTTQAGEFVLLKDGTQVLVRRLTEADRPAVEAFFQRLSDESFYLRFHSGARASADSLNRAMAGHALVGEREGRIVALASYHPLRDPGRAEMAIAVDDQEQGRGIGTAVFERLAADARREGIRRFMALVLASNYRMIDLLRRLGLTVTRTSTGGEIEFEIALREDPAYFASADARRHVAAVASLDPLFAPRAVAVVGASRTPGAIGNYLFRNVLEGGFPGPVYPVNPNARSVCAVRAFPTVSAIPDQVDLSVIVVPAALVLDVARDSLEAGARALVVISAGFAEVGEEGKERQDELVRMCREHGARLVGPNCMGVLFDRPEGALNATFAPTRPPPGNVSVASQSGALGIAILQQTQQLGIGIASFVSMGNKADLSSNDLLERWEDDPATAVILLYLESFGNPHRFSRVARRVGARKPILAVKGGRAAAGQRAAASHTAALAGSETAVTALFRQAGVLRCDTLEELFDATTLLANQPLPEGNRVGIITNAGGLGILAADAAEGSGLELPVLAPSTQARLREMLPVESSVANPVDMLASGSAESYGKALEIVLDDPNVDAAIVLFIPPLVTNAEDVAAALVAACTPPPNKPVLTCFVGTRGLPDLLRGRVAIPSYVYPEAAARALGHAARRAAWLRRPAGEIVTFADVDADAVRAIVDRALAREGDHWLSADEVDRVLAAYHIPRPETVLAHSPEEAVEAASRVGMPAALKLVSTTIVHKSDVGGVRLGLESPGAVAEAFRAMKERLGDAMEGAVVQPMVTGGVECLVGVVGDPVFGPLIAFGLGGVNAEVIDDVSFRLHPLADVDAEELIAGSKAAKLLRGFRGGPPGDVDALRNLLLRLSQLVDDLPEIAELDLNPVVVLPAGQGVRALDARIRLARRGI